MAKVKTYDISQISAWRLWFYDLFVLIKFKLNITVVFSSVMAYLIVLGADAKFFNVALLAMGGFLVTGAANALNQVIEKDFDKLMKRTQNRPVAAGRMNVSEAILIAGLLCISGISLLAMFNPLAALLGMTSLVTFAFLYTPMKRFSPIAVLIGAFPGAFPVLIGCVAAEGRISFLALILFSIQFIWQFPHFWAIAWKGFEDYQKAGYKLLPFKEQKRDPKIGLYAFGYAFLLVPISIALYSFGYSSIGAVVLISLIAVGYSYAGFKLFQEATQKAALKLMLASFVYLPSVLIILYMDVLIFTL